MKFIKRWKVPLIVLGALIVVDLLLRLFGVGVPPAAYCINGAPRGNFRYQPRLIDDAPPSEEGVETILCFGDSWTFGLGVNDKQTWPAVLQNLLDERGDQARVVNLANPADRTADVVELLPSRMLRYRSKKAIVFVGAQDATPLALLEQTPLGNPSTPERCPRPLWRLGHWFTRRYHAFQLSVDSPDPPENKEYLPRRGTVADTQMQLLRLGQLASERKIDLIFITYPSLPTERRGTPYLPLEGRYNFLIHSAAKSFSMHVVDLEERWGNRTENYLLDWLIWPHPNAQGHADIAAAVLEAL